LRFVAPTASIVALATALVAGSGCEKSIDSVIDSTGIPPTISHVSASPTTINTDSILVGGTKKPEDILPIRVLVFARPAHPLGAQEILSVRFTVRQEGNTTVLSTGELTDAGADPDQVKSDGLYSGRASFTIKRADVGTYIIEVGAVDVKGFASNTVLVPVQIVRTNQPPLLADLQAPDTVRLASQDQLLVLQVRASDPNGLHDIHRVIFNSFRPDGSASTGNPFQMFDDGDSNHGDTVRGDGIYSLKIILPASTQSGTYRFEFQAFDKSNDGSNVMIHRLTVRP